MTRKRKNILRWVLIAVAGVLTVGCIVVRGIAGRYITAFDNFLNKVTVGEAMNPGAEEVSIMDAPFAVYISGSDSRAGVDDTARSDVNIVMVVNPEQKKILMVSVPRDTYVQLHGTEGLPDKLTHAGVYGIEMSRATMEDLLEMKIGYTVKVSFATVVKVVDELDGIDIYSDTEMRLMTEGGEKVCEYTVGTQHLDGDCALRFARERKSYETGDRHRGENQEAVIAAILAKMTSSQGYLLRLPSIMDIAADSFRTSFTRKDITDIIKWQMDTRAKWTTEAVNVDGVGAMEPTYSMGADWPLYVMYADEEALARAKAKIQEYLKTAEEADAAVETLESGAK